MTEDQTITLNSAGMDIITPEFSFINLSQENRFLKENICEFLHQTNAENYEDETLISLVN